MVEIAFCLPFVLLFIFLIIWVSFSLHAKSSLDSALNHSIRLAATRGIKETVGSKIISDVQDWTGGGPISGPLQLLLANNRTWLGDADTYYTHLTQNTFPALASMADLPPEYIYFYIYVGEEMRESVGDYVKFPCDPNAADGAGCLSCAPLNPDSLTVSPYAADPPRRSMGFECSFRPSGVFVEPVVGLLRLLSGDNLTSLFVVTRKVYYDMPPLLEG